MDVGAAKITFQNVTIATGQTTGLVPFRLIHASTVFLRPNIATYYITLSSMLLGTGFNYVLLPILFIAVNNISLDLSIIHVGFVFNFFSIISAGRVTEVQCSAQSTGGTQFQIGSSAGQTGLVHIKPGILLLPVYESDVNRE